MSKTTRPLRAGLARIVRVMSAAFLLLLPAQRLHAAGSSVTATQEARSDTTATTAARGAGKAQPVRVAVIGASASAGFGCVYRESRDDGEYACSFRLIDMVRLACPELELVASDLSSGFFFLSPIANGTKAAARAREFKPDCVIALDFLFWYCYGDDAPGGGAVTSEAQRLEKLDLGLKALEGFTVPVLVGDIPDMSRAVGKMLSARQMPSADTLAKANARFADWARSRANVRVIPLAQMQRQLMEENALDIGSTRLEAKPGAPLLQKDELHPAPHGMAGLGCAVASELKAALSRDTGARITGDAETDNLRADRLKADDCEPEPIGTIGRAREELKPSRRATAPKAPPPPDPVK